MYYNNYKIGGEIMDISDRIRIIRKNTGLNQTIFGEKLGVSRSVIKNIELNVNKTGIPESIIKLICCKFSVNESWLKTGMGDMYVETEDSILNQLKNTYKLSNLEYKILASYLKLDTSQREAVEKFIADILEPEPPTIKVAARGNAELEIVSDDDAMRKDIENYIPPTDL